MASRTTVPTNEQNFVTVVSNYTGVDPRVLYTWIAGEGAPGNAYNNYLNIAEPTAQSLGVPTVGTAAAGTAEFGSLANGVQATIAEIEKLGLGNEAGKTPQTQIADIAATNWASSHYGGPGGPNLVTDFASLYGTGALGSKGQVAPLTMASAAAAGGQGQPVGGLGGLPVIGGAITAGGNAVSNLAGVPGSVLSALQWPFQHNRILRFGEIMAGVILAIIGLLMLTRGLTLPAASAVAARPVTKQIGSGAA
jgi:hypothetical protein